MRKNTHSVKTGNLVGRRYKILLSNCLGGFETFLDKVEISCYSHRFQISLICFNEIQPSAEKSITMVGITLFIFHVVVVGILIAVTAFIAYNAGKNKGRFISERQDNRNV